MATRRPVGVAIHSQHSGRVTATTYLLMDPDRMAAQLFAILTESIERMGYVVLGVISAEAPFGRRALSAEKHLDIAQIEWVVFVRE